MGVVQHHAAQAPVAGRAGPRNRLARNAEARGRARAEQRRDLRGRRGGLVHGPGDGPGVTLVATDADLAAIGIEPEDANTPPAGALGAPTDETAHDTATETEATPRARTPREGTKQVKLIAMLRAPDGATIEEIMVALDWASHTIRGAMAGALTKKLGLEVTSEKVEGRGRVYKLC